MVGGAEGLAGVFDHGEVVALGQGEEGHHVGGAAEGVDYEEGTGARRDGRFDGCGREVERVGVDVDEYRGGALVADGVGGGDEGEGGDEDLVTLTDVQGLDG